MNISSKTVVVKISFRTQDLLIKGQQTAGNLFAKNSEHLNRIEIFDFLERNRQLPISLLRIRRRVPTKIAK